MNSFLELAKERCSVRAYKSDCIEAEKLDYILEAARMAPSAVNKQPWKIYMITPMSAFELREKLQRCYDREWFKTAPYYLILCIEHDQSWHRRLPSRAWALAGSATLMLFFVMSSLDSGLTRSLPCSFPLAILPMTLWRRRRHERRLRK